MSRSLPADARRRRRTPGFLPLACRKAERSSVFALSAANGPRHLRGGETMQYLLLIHADEKAMQTTPPEQIGATPCGLRRLHEGDGGRGREQGRPAACTRPRPRPRLGSRTARPQVINGPYAEVKEQLGGYFIIDAPRSRRRDLVGRALPRRAIRRDRSAADLGDVKLLAARRKQTATAGFPDLGANGRRNAGHDDWS